MLEADPADLAVVIVNYNAGDYVSRCVASVLGSTGGARVDVLVVDNASADGSAQRAARAHPEVRLIENAYNRGLSAAWNQGILNTSAPHLLLLNPDAEIWSGDLAAIVRTFQESPDVAVVGPVVRNADGTMYESGRKFPTLPEAIGHAFLGPFLPRNRFTRSYKITDWARTTEREVDWVSGSCWAVRRAALDEVGMMDESFFLYGEELDLCTRLRAAGWKVLFTPALEVVHEGGVSTGRSRATHLMHSASVYRYFRKHRARGWAKALLPLAWVALRARAEIVALRDRVRK
jgi:GT2 family glycosyltransferase